jgi:hypothetical protein
MILMLYLQNDVHTLFPKYRIICEEGKICPLNHPINNNKLQADPVFNKRTEPNMVTCGTLETKALSNYVNVRFKTHEKLQGN